MRSPVRPREAGVEGSGLAFPDGGRRTGMGTRAGTGTPEGLPVVVAVMPDDRTRRPS
ncbi:hypothetical protein [Streptomyces naganishii]|uniref:Uncharacterized protein n=1 Tax=Streptomyces naganishii JCM 4654 TaxID=1306179 RepID=A0A919CUU2_9ACTN|nr:hypothetical protein [Streptomyces naganishii]GHD87398.1 hypothetical protein GCM10010508_19370 [Streptomyces naganishii JCM 4654]